MRHQFEFIGVPTPQRRQAVLPVFKRLQVENTDHLLACAHVLWTLPAREFQYVATDLLARKWKALGINDIAHLLTIAQQASWWDSVDPLAGVVGDVLKAARVETPQAQAVMDAALQHESLWVRRIAMIHQLGWREHTDEDRLFGYARALAAESDFFIRKAIGWALRDYAWHAPDAVIGFLSASRDLISPLSLREASKHLPSIS
jgi:3-methyladenine DNA glycosylase AlkD